MAYGTVGPVPFSAPYLICRHVQTDGRTDGQTDGQTDELFWVELGKTYIRFLQINRVCSSVYLLFW